MPTWLHQGKKIHQWLFRFILHQNSLYKKPSLSSNNQIDGDGICNNFISNHSVDYLVACILDNHLTPPSFVISEITNGKCHFNRSGTKPYFSGTNLVSTRFQLCLPQK